jgi:hypothetical protein
MRMRSIGMVSYWAAMAPYFVAEMGFPVTVAGPVTGLGAIRLEVQGRTRQESAEVKEVYLELQRSCDQLTADVDRRHAPRTHEGIGILTRECACTGRLLVAGGEAVVGCSAAADVHRSGTGRRRGHCDVQIVVYKNVATPVRG